uniref:U1-type domain-containing protein n=1 Tax=Trichuris muris TaxID=70415 RepID=A0A5S6QS10_TRIMR
MSGALPVAADDHRRKWDTGEYERLARERLEEEKRREKEKVTPKDKVRREILKPRDYKIDLDSKVGKSIVITKTTPASEAGGYYCNVCDCIVKDSINFLDHINGKKHQRNMGMSMRVKKSTLDEVKARFATKRQEMEEKKKGYSIEERMREIQEEERKLAEYKQQKRAKRLKPQQEESEDDEESELMAKTMGIKAFSTSKK